MVRRPVLAPSMCPVSPDLSHGECIPACLCCRELVTVPGAFPGFHSSITGADVTSGLQICGMIAPEDSCSGVEPGFASRRDRDLCLEPLDLGSCFPECVMQTPSSMECLWCPERLLWPGSLGSHLASASLLQGLQGLECADQCGEEGKQEVGRCQSHTHWTSSIFSLCLACFTGLLSLTARWKILHRALDFFSSHFGVSSSSSCR